MAAASTCAKRPALSRRCNPAPHTRPFCHARLQLYDVLNADRIVLEASALAFLNEFYGAASAGAAAAEEEEAEEEAAPVAAAAATAEEPAAAAEEEEVPAAVEEEAPAAAAVEEA